MKLGSMLRELKKPRQLFLKVLHHYPEMFKWMSDEAYLRFVYKIALEKKLNLENPQTFNEKLQWLKLHNRKDIYTTMVDKYEAKKYVADCIGAEYIIPTLGVWENFDDIDFDCLPNQFVLKCTHDSGGLVICKDKSKFDKVAARKKIERSLKRNFYWFGREWPYKNVQHRIIAEQYMADNLKDGLKEDFYDEAWNHLNVQRPAHGNAILPTQYPKQYELMKKLAVKLSEKMPFARIDFYKLNEKVYFGEITFYPASGFEGFKPDEWDLKLGEWIKLPGGYRLNSDDYSVIISDFCGNNKEKKALVDYKFFCFNGKVKCLYVSDTEKHLLRFYDADFNPLDIKRDDYKDFDTSPRKPIMFEQMKLLAEKLSSNIPHVRVDFYEINGNIYFGEMTFYTGSGFIPFKEKKWDLTLGELIVLPH